MIHMGSPMIILIEFGVDVFARIFTFYELRRLQTSVSFRIIIFFYLSHKVISQLEGFICCYLVCCLQPCQLSFLLNQQTSKHFLFFIISNNFQFCIKSYFPRLNFKKYKYCKILKTHLRLPILIPWTNLIGCYLFNIFFNTLAQVKC